MPLNHTGENICELVESVLEEWEIPPPKISAILTDNGSNMISAFWPQAREGADSVGTEGDNQDISPQAIEDVDTEGDNQDIESDDDADLVSLVRDFEEKESDHEIAFSKLNRISCFAHTLQLVVHKFDQLTEFKALLTRAHSRIRKFNTSAEATEKLITKCGKKLVKDCRTRWSSTYLLIDRLLTARTSLTEVLQELE